MRGVRGAVLQGAVFGRQRQLHQRSAVRGRRRRAQRDTSDSGSRYELAQQPLGLGQIGPGVTRRRKLECVAQLVARGGRERVVLARRFENLRLFGRRGCMSLWSISTCEVKSVPAVASWSTIGAGLLFS
jgi:hypothetical protein